jgi:pilus assembly protein CpaC
MRVHSGAGFSVNRWILLGAALMMAAAAPAAGQRIISQAEQTIQVERGKSTLIVLDRDPSRIQLTDTAVANFAFGANQRELIMRGLEVGTTSMFVWDAAGGIPRLYTLEVVPDITALQTQLQTIFPTQDIQVTVTGNSVILSGQVRDPTVVRRAIELAEGTGATAINNIQAPSAEQVLLHVRFAEVRKSALKRLGADLFFQNVADIDNVFRDDATADVETLSEGIVNLFLTGENASLDAVIRALRSNGDFRSLAEPNLIALEGQEATFLAGGEFPYPTIQSTGTGTTNAVTIVFREFGIRLRFTPNVTNSGTIRLAVAPEVSSLDFANGLTFQGFVVPALSTRRAETHVELRPGQHLAIAGLLDNTMLESVDKIPFLGDLPILGTFFRSKLDQQDRTELLVLVTPHIVEPSDVAPPMPTNEPTEWRWDRKMRIHPDSIARTMPQRRRGEGNTP